MKPEGCKFTDKHFDSLSILRGGCSGTDCTVAICPKRTQPETYFQAIMMFKNWIINRVFILQKEQEPMPHGKLEMVNSRHPYQMAIDELNGAIDKLVELGLQ